MMGENSHRDIENSFACFQRWMDIRIQDMDAALHYLTDRATQEKNLALINPKAIGAAGHSLGGSAALAWLACGRISRPCWCWNLLHGGHHRHLGREFTESGSI